MGRDVLRDPQEPIAVPVLYSGPLPAAGLGIDGDVPPESVLGANLRPDLGNSALRTTRARVTMRPFSAFHGQEASLRKPIGQESPQRNPVNLVDRPDSRHGFGGSGPGPRQQSPRPAVATGRRCESHRRGIRTCVRLPFAGATAWLRIVNNLRPLWRW